MFYFSVGLLLFLRGVKSKAKSIDESRFTDLKNYLNKVNPKSFLYNF